MKICLKAYNDHNRPNTIEQGSQGVSIQNDLDHVRTDKQTDMNDDLWS